MTTAPDEIKWENPPDPTNTTRWSRVVAALKAKPGEWAVVGEGGTHPGFYGTAQRRLKVLGCEAVQRKVSDTEWRLYARWPEEVEGDGAA